LEVLAYSSPIRAALVEAMVKSGFHVCNQSDKLTLFWTIAAPDTGLELMITLQGLRRLRQFAWILSAIQKISSPSFALAT
jgi:hypothetical protein